MKIWKEYTWTGSTLSNVELYRDSIEYTNVTKINISLSDLTNDGKIGLFLNNTSAGPYIEISTVEDYRNTTNWNTFQLFIRGVYDTTEQALFLSCVDFGFPANQLTLRKQPYIGANDVLKFVFIKENPMSFVTGDMINAKIGLTGTKYLTKKDLIATNKVDKSFLTQYDDNTYPVFADVKYKENKEKIYGFVLADVLQLSSTGTSLYSVVFPVADNKDPFKLFSTKSSTNLPTHAKNLVHIYTHKDGKFFLQERNTSTVMRYTRLFNLDSTQASIGKSWYWLRDNYQFTDKASGVAYGNQYGVSLKSDGSTEQYDSTSEYTWFTGVNVRNKWGDLVDELVFTKTNGGQWKSKTNNITFNDIPKSRGIVLFGDAGCVLLINENNKITVYFDVNKYYILSFTPTTTGSYWCNQKNVSKNGEIALFFYNGNTIKTQILKIQIINGLPVLSEVKIIDSTLPYPIVRFADYIEPNAHGQISTNQYCDFWMFMVSTTNGVFIMSLSDDWTFKSIRLPTDGGDVNTNCFFIPLEQLHESDVTYLKNIGVYDENYEPKPEPKIVSFAKTEVVFNRYACVSGSYSSGPRFFNLQIMRTTGVIGSKITVKATSIADSGQSYFEVIPDANKIFVKINAVKPFTNEDNQFSPTVEINLLYDEKVVDTCIVYQYASSA